MMDNTQTFNNHCNISIQFDGTDGWQIQQIMPTDRHFIPLYTEWGIDYIITDAIVLLSKIIDGSMMLKGIGLNYSMVNQYDEYWLDETGRASISDNLNMKTLEEMIRYITHIEDCTREEAILNIKSDFERTKVRIDHEVQKLFRQIE